MPLPPRSRPSGSDGTSSERARPLLGGGEQLARDARPVRNPGDKFHPQNLGEVRRSLGPIAREMHERTRSLDSQLRGERVVIEATLLPNYLAASYHPEELRSDADLVPIGTRNARGTLRTQKQAKENAPTKTLLLAATDRSLERLDQLLNDEEVRADEKVLDDLVKLQGLALPGEQRVITRRGDEERDDNDTLTWEAVLHPAIAADGRLSDRVQGLVMRRWKKLVEDHDGRVHSDYVRRVGNLTFMPVTLRRGAVDAIAAFNPLRVLRPMPTMRSVPADNLRRVEPAAPIVPPAVTTPPPQRVAVFDGGAGSHPLLDPFVAHGDLTSSDPDPEDEAHGTLVTSALLYGHLKAGAPTSPPPAQVDHFRILPRPSHVSYEDEAYWVMDQIVNQIESTNQWKIVSLSYGPDEPVDEDSEPNRFTAEIDRLAYDRDITFLVAAGNLREEERGMRSPLGLDRVKAPADGVNAIGVGSCAEPPPAPPERCDYSCWGPGRHGLRLAPLGVAFGGNQNGQQFFGAGPDGSYQAGSGTSYATPNTARALAALMNELPREHHHVNVLRAFGAHFAEPPAERDFDAVGYGRFPEDYGAHLDCPDGTVTVLITDTLERSQTQAYPLPLPTDGLEGRLKLRWTVSFVTPVDPEDAAEYTLAGVETAFRPNINKYRLEPPHPRAGRAKDVDLIADKDLINERGRAGWQLSKNSKTRSGTALRSEHVRRDAGLWETVVRYETGALASSLNRPEVWLTYYERAQGQLVPRRDAAQLDVAVLMTVEAPKVPDLYERVRAQADFQALSPIVATVPVSVGV